MIKNPKIGDSVWINHFEKHFCINPRLEKYILRNNIKRLSGTIVRLCGYKTSIWVRYDSQYVRRIIRKWHGKLQRIHTGNHSYDIEFITRKYKK